MKNPMETNGGGMVWEITVGGYGSFLFYGTEAEAEEMRRHKARWEGGPAQKRLVGDTVNLSDEQ